ncbi:meprin A subunit beta-like isoform X2 [Vanacampus margaritifer]
MFLAGWIPLPVNILAVDKPVLQRLLKNATNHRGGQRGTRHRLRMRGFIFLLVIVLVPAAASTTRSVSEIVEIDKDVPEANKDLLYDDILPEPFQRSAVSSENKLWTSPVPYVLNSSLDLNAKGVTLRALEQFRLKSCIDFKVRSDELYFINVKKLDGCFSYIGRVVTDGQDLSIGQFCDHIAIVEHEFLHAFGFYHEQSREDRDDYVTVVLENVLQGREHNFLKAEGSTAQGVPYDYMSVMHYGKDAFSNGNGSTIITKDAAFQDVIGQRLGMSRRDVQELNLLYNCNSSVAFSAYCGFALGDPCNMATCSPSGLGGWQMLTQAAGGPHSDHTDLSNGGGYFMHANTTSAFLETPRMSPSRECHVQCLQFYYYHTGGPSDRLNIWIREFTDDEDSTGLRRLVGQIAGAVTSHWQIHHVSLNASRLFQVEFESVKGSGSPNSTGGFSVDDINVSETQCPHNTLQLDDFENLLNSSVVGTEIYGPRRYSAAGYAYRVGVVLAGTHVSVFIQLLNGTNDDELSWPCDRHQWTALMMDQEASVILGMSKQRSLTSDNSTSGDGSYLWGDPRNSSRTGVDENNQTAFIGSKFVWNVFATLEEMKSRHFLKGGSLVLAFSFQDISPLVDGHVLPCPQVTPVQVTHPPQEDQEGTCASRVGTPTPLPDLSSARTTTPLPDLSSARTTIPTPLPDLSSARTTTPTPLPDLSSARTTTPTPLPDLSSARTTIPTPLPDLSSARTTTPTPLPDLSSVFSLSPGMSSSSILVLLGVLMFVIG